MKLSVNCLAMLSAFTLSLFVSIVAPHVIEAMARICAACGAVWLLWNPLNEPEARIYATPDKD